MKKKQENNIIKYPKQYSFSIGFVIIGVMFIYMIYHLFTYITAENITIYEVSKGSISSNLEYNALAIRDESVYYAEKSGHIIYLAENISRVGMKSNIYALDELGDIVTTMSTSSLNDTNIDKKDLEKLQSDIYTYVLSYDDSEYYKVYSFKTNINAQIQQLYNLSVMNSMDTDVNAAISAGSFHIYSSPTPGLVVYSTDGLEDLTIDTYSPDNFTNEVITNNLKSQETIINGQPIYKIINSDKWNLICEIDQNLYNNLIEENYIEIEFLEDETKTWTACRVEEKYGKYYLILTLDDSINRFATQRFVHIKLLDKDITGLKIPNSSIVEKQFYTIPKSYFYQGDNSTELGLLVQETSSATRFVSPTIYYETDDFYYIDNDKVTNGDILIKASSSERYIIGSEIDSLKGVYNVNKGYAVFKQIEIKYQNEDYAIIKTGTNYGISMYDHIVLQGNAVEENKIIN